MTIDNKNDVCSFYDSVSAASRKSFLLNCDIHKFEVKEETDKAKVSFVSLFWLSEFEFCL